MATKTARAATSPGNEKSINDVLYLAPGAFGVLAVSVLLSASSRDPGGKA
jgi:hypothetical protein